MKLKTVGYFLLMATGLTIGCEQKAAQVSASKAPHGPNERYYTVQQKLDEGGSFYMYADLKGVLQSVLDQMKPVLDDPAMDPQARQVFDMAQKVVEQLGILGIHDVGMSSLPEDQLNRNKIYISSPDGRTGLLKILGGDPHEFSLPDRASSNTLAMVSADVDVPAAWALITQLIADVGGQQATDQLNQGLAAVSMQTGINPSLIIPTLSGHINFLMEADPVQKMVLPLGMTPIQFDSPRFVLMIGVTDSQLYDALCDLIQRNQAGAGPEQVDGDLHVTPLVSPPNPFWVVSPALGFDGKYVYVTTHADYIQALCKPEPDGSTLQQNEEFLALRKGLPEKGNGLIYVSSQLKKTIAGAFDTALTSLPNNTPQSVKDRVAQMKDAAQGTLVMRINESEGIMIISRSEAGAMRYLGAAPVAPVAILAAIAVPNFLEAQTRSKVSRARADMRSLATAIETYYIDNNVYPEWNGDTNRNFFGGYPDMQGMPGLARAEYSNGSRGLTTPVTYITHIPTDPFASKEGVPAGERGVPFCYWRPEKGEGWIVWSAGPDGHYDLTADNIAQAYDLTKPLPSQLLASLTYDPSNGTVSKGDVWRIKH